MTRIVLVSAGVALVVAMITVGAARLILPPVSEPAAPQAAAIDRQEIGVVVREYLLENPGVLEEVIAALEQEQFEAQAEEQRQAIGQNRERLFDSAHGFVAGNPDGDATVVEFFDYNCPYCRQMMPVLMELIESDPQLRVILRDWPVLGEQSVEAARVAIAIKHISPDQFLEFHEAMAGQRGRVDGDRALEVAEELGLDRAELAEAMASEAVDAALRDAMELGDGLGLRGTPSYVVGNEVLGGAVPADRLREQITRTRESG